MMEQLKAKAREILVVFTAVAVLLSAAIPMIGDMILILITGAMGWFLSDKPAAK
jgi:hypothetical protein